MQQRILRDRQYAVTHSLTPHPAITLEVRLPSSRIKRTRLVGQDRAAAPPRDVRATRDVHGAPSRIRWLFGQLTEWPEGRFSGVTSRETLIFSRVIYVYNFIIIPSSKVSPKYQINESKCQTEDIDVNRINPGVSATQGSNWYLRTTR